MMDTEDTFAIELVINDWSSFLEATDVFRKSPSVSFQGLKWKFRVCCSREAPDQNHENAVRMSLQIGFKQPDPYSSYNSHAAIFLTADPSDVIGNYFKKKRDVMVFGKFSCAWVVAILREQIVDDTVVLKVNISSLEKVCLSQPSSYTIGGPTGHTNVDGILEGNRYPTLYISHMDDQLEKPIQLFTLNPFMLTSFKPLKFCPPPHQIENPEGVENFQNHLAKQDRQLRPDCKELVVLKSHYPRDEGGLAWINLIQISMDPKRHSVTNCWLKFPQPPQLTHDGLAFTKIGWIIWKCDQMPQRYKFRLRIWVLEENEVQNVHDKLFTLALVGQPKFLFTFSKIYALGICDMATCALETNNEWITYPVVPDLGINGSSKFLQWRDDCLVSLDGDSSSHRLFFYEINFVKSNDKKWFNVIPRFAMRNVPWNWDSWPIVISDSLLVLSGPNDTITVFMLQPLSLAASALLVVERQRAQYMEIRNWNGDRVSVGGLIEEELQELFGKVRHWRALNKYC